MPRLLLFLLLLILGRAIAVSDITPGLAAGDRDLGAGNRDLGAGNQDLGAGDQDLSAGDRAVLAELAGLAEPVPPQALGVPCRTLRPDSLPGFSRLPPLPRGLARAAMALALRGAGWGSACVDPARLRTPLPGTEPTPPTGQGSREFPLCRGAVRRRREDEDACSPAGEREAHRVLSWVPGVGIFYNLGTSVYFAFRGCEATASTRALEAAEDLGYAGLAALTGGLGGPVALGVQLGLQPGLKAGVRALFGYFTSAGEPSPVPTAHSGPVVIV
ncbi:APOF protein, partial [Picathartes gymnocephalus]|nr:APOF protein [Picathartes gymnocephalus]